MQVVFFYQLRDLTRKAEALSHAAEMNAERTHAFESLIEAFAAGWADIGSTLFEKDAKAADPEFFRQRLQSALDTCKPYCTENERTRAIYAAAQKLADDEYAQLKSAAATDLSNEATIARVMDGITTFKVLLAKTSPQLNSMKQQVDAERAAFVKAKFEEEEYRRKIDAQTTFGIFADLIIVAALLAWFLKDISNRLTLLVQNAKVIPTGKPLTARVGGTDELAYLDGVIHDVSEALRAAAAHHKSLMEMVAHDLRSPLTSAMLALDSLVTRAKEESEETRVNRIQTTRQTLGRMIALVEDLLTIDKLEAGKLELNHELIDAKAMVQESIASMETLASIKKLTVENAVQPVTVDADRLRLLQVFNNLISNAIKYSPDGGTIRVSTTVKPTELTFAVSDRGKGIPQEKQGELFNKFYQVSDRDGKNGFGLGLAITKLIVSAHGGSVGVDSKQGEGTTFWFSLPSEVDFTEPV